VQDQCEFKVEIELIRLYNCLKRKVKPKESRNLDTTFSVTMKNGENDFSAIFLLKIEFQVSFKFYRKIKKVFIICFFFIKLEKTLIKLKRRENINSKIIALIRYVKVS